MSFEKENFLRTRFIRHLQQLDGSAPPLWGKMSVQQMIEHFGGDVLQVANGRLVIEMFTPADQLPQMIEFLLSEKPFKKNLRNPLLGEEPLPLRFNTVQASIANLHGELIHFFEVFEQKPMMTTLNPIFGPLNFDQNVQLLYKHALHHLRQFGVNPYI
ncbi:hypothetical protein LZZ85_17320 [Terrimonas sp. NA20]|uniref:DUF1569 domain-containing protein n=1 Tax=Terrimonas ginsenosidimutans TaxID=2908004 RepID=A0ABS9KUV4_9BACT|nr:hypothetical protein [Terrimonas ginsenosidimutans]MCG2616060.1 hypothetical protein [Terrimonas ginsenosidimutans]